MRGDFAHLQMWLQRNLCERWSSGCCNQNQKSEWLPSNCNWECLVTSCVYHIFWYTSANSSIYLQAVLNFWSLKRLESTSTSLRTVGSKPHGKSTVSRSLGWMRYDSSNDPTILLVFRGHFAFPHPHSTLIGLCNLWAEQKWLWSSWSVFSSVIPSDPMVFAISPLLHSEIRTSMILLTNGFWASRTRWQVYNEVGSMGVNAGNSWANVKDALFLTALRLKIPAHNHLVIFATRKCRTRRGSSGSSFV